TSLRVRLSLQCLLLETPGRPREPDPRAEYFTVMRRPDHVTDARAEQSKSAQNKKSGIEITHYRRPRPKPIPDHLVPNTPSLTDIPPYGLPTGTRPRG